jgi:hypothetical protein
MNNIEMAMAEDMVERLKNLLGYLPPIEQVDLDDDEQGDVTAIVYWGRGDDEWAFLNVQRPELTFDAAALEEQVCRLAAVDVSALAEAIKSVASRDPDEECG